MVSAEAKDGPMGGTEPSMHEVGLIREALAMAIGTARRAGAGRIDELTFGLVQGGEVTPETVRALVAALSVGTLAERARLAFEWLARLGLCARCGTAFPIADETGCPFCGGAALPDSSGTDLVLLSMDVRGEEGQPCAAPYSPA
jgi:Zn finger protein HypA/HybF involved in hydrogenase expression